MRAAIIAGLVTLTAILATAEPHAERIRTEDLIEQMQDAFGNVVDELFLVLIEGYLVREGGELVAGGSGSGFIVDHDTENDTFYVATNHHVSSGPIAGPYVGSSWNYIQVATRDGRTFEAVRLGGDPRYDVAFISFEYSTDEIFDWRPSISNLGDSEAVQAGDLVYAAAALEVCPRPLRWASSVMSRVLSRVEIPSVSVCIFGQMSLSTRAIPVVHLSACPTER